MSLKAKLATTIAALCMVICLLTVGVWAASSATVKISGTVSFAASDVNAIVYGSASSNKENGFTKEKTKVTDGDFDATDDPAEGSWALGAFEFTAKDEVITLTLTVANRSTDREIALTFNPTLGDKPITADGVTVGNVTAKLVNVAAKVGATTEQNVESENYTEASVSITLEIADKNLSVEGVTIGGDLVLSNAELENSGN